MIIKKIRPLSRESVWPFFNILSLFHPFFKSNKLYKRTSISVFVPKKDKTNNLTMNSHFTVTVTGSSGLVWPISQKWSILNNTSFSSIKSSLIVFLMKKKSVLWKFSAVCHIACDTFVSQCLFVLPRMLRTRYWV